MKTCRLLILSDSDRKVGGEAAWTIGGVETANITIDATNMANSRYLDLLYLLIAFPYIFKHSIN